MGEERLEELVVVVDSMPWASMELRRQESARWSISMVVPVGGCVEKKRFVGILVPLELVSKA